MKDVVGKEKEEGREEEGGHEPPTEGRSAGSERDRRREREPGTIPHGGA